ncbi:MAG: methylase [Pseudonocardiales bacterium]|nr:methylase [Pseudonocardiales bacterium]
MPKIPRLAAGRARALGLPTRGTTNPNRLRRMDRWLVYRFGSQLSRQDDSLVIDLGYGATPITAIELRERVQKVAPNARILGLELDPARVEAAQFAADPPGLDFARGGFELAGHRPLLVRAANVLRQYDEPAAARAWTTIQSHLGPGGHLIEGTFDEIGRLGAWVLLDQQRPLSLTFAAKLDTLVKPSELAERLPKSLIHHNRAGQPIHQFLNAFDSAWATAAPLATFSPRQRWIAACAQLGNNWPVVDNKSRWRLGELTIDWEAVARPSQSAS